MTSIGTSVRHQLLYRTAVALVILCAVAALLVPAGAQFSKKRRQSQLRALGLLEFGANNKPHLVPITIFVDGRYYDASIYRASPVPMALEAGIVYEAFRTGTPVGLFTISTPQTLAGNWRALGNWRVESPNTGPKLVNKAASKSSSREDSDRPVLRRPGSSSSPTSSSPPASTPSGSGPPPGTTPPPSSSGDDDRPTLHRPESSNPQTSSTPPPASTPSASAPPAQSTSSTDDSGRPTLRRGKPSEEQADLIPEPNSPSPTLGKKTATAPAKSEAPASGQPNSGQALPAISDTDGPEPHPFTYELKPDDRQAYMKKVADMASSAIAKFEKARDPRFASCPLNDTSMRAFDPNYSNEPDLVFSGHCTLYAGRTESAAAGRPGRRPVPRPSQPGEKRGEAWVTVVARVDLYNEPRQLFASVTDSRHLDEVPRLELIDAVDVDGDGSGELLFREINDTSKAFIVYRVGPDRLYSLFEGGSGE